MKPRIIIIGGPTASGKNQVALEIAARYPSEIVNCDSRQIYRDLTIGTNQPSAEEQSTVPHHLFAFLDPAAHFSASDYEKVALPVITEISNRGNLPLVVGGTGFYIKALLKGTWAVPGKDPELRARLRNIERRHGPGFLHKLLQRLDPRSAENISANDTYRVIRAIEIYLRSGVRRSDLDAAVEERFEAVKVALLPERALLQENIRARTDAMFRAGWIEETRKLLEKHPDFEFFPASRSIGYQEIIRLIKGELNELECKELIIRKTTRYAKQQATWFRNQDGFVTLPSVQELVKSIDSVLQLEEYNTSN